MYIRTSIGIFILIITAGIAVSTIITSSISADDMFFSDETVFVAGSGYEHRLIYVGATVIVADVADTEEKRATGLSFKNKISPDGGMLFIFPSEDRYGIWMKDMSFPVDVLWVSKDLRVIDITPNISPDTYPETYHPSAPVLYAIETPVGFASAHNISVGNSVSW